MPRTSYIVEAMPEHQFPPAEFPEEFVKHVQAVILRALLNQGLLSRQQFDFCMVELRIHSGPC